MLKTIFLALILIISSCGNENKSKIEDKKFPNKNDSSANFKKPFNNSSKIEENKAKIFDVNGNEISFSDFNSKNSIEVVQQKKNIEKSKQTYFLTPQRGFFTLGASEPKIEIEDAFESVLFFIKFSTGNLVSTSILLKDYPSLEERIKEKNEIEKYDADNFLNFIDLFKLEEINKSDPEITVLNVASGSKYKLIFKKEIVETKDLGQILKSSFFQLNYVREEIIKRLKKSDKKIEKEIVEIENDKSLINSVKVEKFSKELKDELYKIASKIVDEAKVFLTKVQLEIIQKAKIDSYKIEITVN